eukprot:TRINITY_DN80507_c0_g1_i1.p1 TRINITY_DN80507_c0_g1~~TRINITY_DN80507_c0_g1_i1.p1  ORF type:complete len:566 (+),score=152.24 TRINITY_DN80507_c0_g1_i1:82-1779(+)
MAFLRIINLCGLAAPAFALSTEMNANFLNRAAFEVATDGDLAEAVGLSARDANVERLMKELEPVFNALPKDAAGRIGFPLVRYTLHRNMVDRHGWHIRGLAPDGKDMLGSSPQDVLQDWAPTQLREALVRRFGSTAEMHQHSMTHGLTLEEVAVVAAMVEEAADKEADARLEKLYSLYKLHTDAPEDRHWVKEAVEAYMVTYINALTFHPTNFEEAVNQLNHFRTWWNAWPPMARWVDGLMENMTVGSSKISWREAKHIVEEVGRRYVNYDVNVCHDLKSMLMKLKGEEDKGQPGRVPLSKFYDQGMTKDTFFRFTESVSYLRDLGALDESDAENPSVIIPNYVTSRTQCLEASKLYAVCCRSECEGFMRHLEDRIAKSAAKPSEIVALVEGMSSETVKAPRILSPKLLQHLDKIATVHNGVVPLHGRLFAQFMHHAYPNECPYPHVSGTTNPRAPEDWMRLTGRNSTEASKEEMRQHIQSAYNVNAQGVLSAEGGDINGNVSHAVQRDVCELPWTDTEELLVVYAPEVGDKGWAVPGGLFTLRTLCGAFGVLSVLSLLLRCARS